MLEVGGRRRESLPTRPRHQLIRDAAISDARRRGRPAKIDDVDPAPTRQELIDTALALATEKDKAWEKEADSRQERVDKALALAIERDKAWEEEADPRQERMHKALAKAIEKDKALGEADPTPTRQELIDKALAAAIEEEKASFAEEIRLTKKAKRAEAARIEQGIMTAVLKAGLQSELPLPQARDSRRAIVWDDNADMKATIRDYEQECDPKIAHAVAMAKAEEARSSTDDESRRSDAWAAAWIVHANTEREKHEVSLDAAEAMLVHAECQLERLKTVISTKLAEIGEGDRPLARQCMNEMVGLCERGDPKDEDQLGLALVKSAGKSLLARTTSEPGCHKKFSDQERTKLGPYL